MAVSVQTYTYRDVTLTLATSGGPQTYSSSTGAAHGSAVETVVVGESSDLSLTIGGADVIRITDRGSFDQLRLGDDQPAEISGTIQFRDLVDAAAPTLAAILISSRQGDADDKLASIGESTSVSGQGNDDAEVFTFAMKIAWANAGNAADTSTIAVNVCSCTSVSVAESAGDFTKLSFTAVIHDKPSAWYIA